MHFLLSLSFVSVFVTYVVCVTNENDGRDASSSASHSLRHVADSEMPPVMSLTPSSSSSSLSSSSRLRSSSSSRSPPSNLSVLKNLLSPSVGRLMSRVRNNQNDHVVINVEEEAPLVSLSPKSLCKAHLEVQKKNEEDREAQWKINEAFLKSLENEDSRCEENQMDADVDICTICQDSLLSEKLLVADCPSKHDFHEQCLLAHMSERQDIKNWVEAACPNCRQKMPILWITENEKGVRMYSSKPSLSQWMEKHDGSIQRMKPAIIASGCICSMSALLYYLKHFENMEWEAI